MTNLNTLTLSAMVALYNDAIEQFGAPEGMAYSENGFKSKAKAIEAIETLCDHGNLAVAFDGDTAVIVDATPTEPAQPLDASGNVLDYPGDGKGDKVRGTRFHYASDVWLKANPRGEEAREAYRTWRKKLARGDRKEGREAAPKVDMQAAIDAAVAAALAKRDAEHAAAQEAAQEAAQ